MEEIPEDSPGYDDWYESIGHRELGGTDISLDDVLAHGPEIRELAANGGVANVRVIGHILDRPLEPPEHVHFIVDLDRTQHGYGLPYVMFQQELIRLLRHYITVDTAEDAGPVVANSGVTV